MNSSRSNDPQLNGKADSLDRALVAELQSDARMSYATLGGKLGVTGMTAANRLQKLRQSDLLRLRVTPNFAAYGLATEVIGMIQADVAVHPECISTLEASPYVIRIDRVTGEYDLDFAAIFPSEVAMGGLVRELRAIDGLRRLVIYHRIETIKDGDGWSAVWAEPGTTEEPPFEIAPGVRVPEHLRGKVATAAQWLNAFVAGDTATVRELSDPEVNYVITPPQAAAGMFDGMAAVLGEVEVAGKIYRHLWHRIIGVSEASDPYDIVIDSFNTAERRKGAVRTAFARMAFGFVQGKVRRVVSLGQLDLPDLPDAIDPNGAIAAVR